MKPLPRVLLSLFAATLLLTAGNYLSERHGFPEVLGTLRCLPIYLVSVGLVLNEAWPWEPSEGRSVAGKVPATLSILSASVSVALPAILPLVAGILAIILGHVARARATRHSYRTMGLVAFLTGYIELGGFLLLYLMALTGALVVGAALHTLRM